MIVSAMEEREKYIKKVKKNEEESWESEQNKNEHHRDKIDEWNSKKTNL